MYIVASGDLSKNFTRKLIFLVANATVLVAVWSPVCVLLTCLVGKINVVNSNQSVFRVWNGCILESIR